MFSGEDAVCSRLDKKQDEYLKSLDQQLQTAETSSLQVWGGREGGGRGGEGGRELYYVDGVLMLFPP